MKPIIVGNWKCNPISLAEAKQLFSSVAKGIRNTRPGLSRRVEIVICPPFVYLSEVGKQKSDLKLGAQDCFWEEKGAFTGEISGKMLKNLGCQYVIIGHSEGRKYQKETDDMINKKLEAVLKIKLKAILCIDNVSQVKKDLKGIPQKELKNLILAYEPLFAIGTGKPCSPEKAKNMRVSIQRNLKKTTLVLYGGSVDSQNAKDYVKKAGFQGLLVGGASLKPKEFIGIIKNVR